MPDRYRAIFFDAGDTLIYLHPSMEVLIARGVRRLGYPDVTREAIRDAMPRANALRDDRIRQAHQAGEPLDKESEEFWGWYYAQLLQAAGLTGDLESCTRGLFQAIQSGRAFRAFADAAPALRKYRSLGLTIGLVSNTNPAIHDILSRVGLAPLLNPLIASYAVGFEKPDPRIFGPALAAARVRAYQALYVGDNPVVDEPAARGAGMDFVLIDRKRRYPNFPGTRITRLSELDPLVRDPQDLAHGFHRPPAGY